jgi:2-polyprenyl-3-methyl-5-hydroxy-6-metoxy-1,4-benzoquinol methylase
LVVGDLVQRRRRVVAELIWNRLDEQPELKPHVEAFSDEQARVHFGEDEPLDSEHWRRGVRLFHAWRVHVLRERIGARLAEAKLVDVGDTDGLILKHLGKSGVGFNLSDAALRNIRANKVEAVGGDAGEGLPFADGEFDYVLCFETLEHVESPHQVLTELARVTAPDGRLFISIPWVPVTAFHSRDPSVQRGYQHICELAHDDFHALVTHTPLRVVWEDVCWIIGKPRTLEQRLFLRMSRGVTVEGSFRGFQFFELAHAQT